MQNKIYDNEFVTSKENMKKNEEIIEQEKELVSKSDTKQNIEYKRIDVDGGKLDNEADIEYFKAIQYNDIIDNCLLGDFDAYGNYIVNPVIVEQLLKMKKNYSSAYDKSVFVESVKGFDDYGKINFRLKWTNDNKGQKIVVLELLENISRVNGYFENTNHVALLGVSINEDTSTEAIYKYFNIVKKSSNNGDDGDDGDDGAEKENNQDIIDILNRISYFQIAKVGQRKFMSKYYKDAYEKKIDLLSKSARGVYLLEDFNKEYLYCKNKFFKENDAEYYKYLNQLIDAIIERNIDFIKDDKNLYKELLNINKQSASMFKAANDMVINATNQKVNDIKNRANELKSTNQADFSLDKEEKKSEKLDIGNSFIVKDDKKSSDNIMILASSNKERKEFSKTDEKTEIVKQDLQDSTKNKQQLNAEDLDKIWDDVDEWTGTEANTKDVDEILKEVTEGYKSNATEDDLTSKTIDDQTNSMNNEYNDQEYTSQ